MKNTVLVVDDIANNINIVVNILIKNRINVVIAQSGKDALKYLENKLPDLILLDIMMPGMSGFEVCKIIKSKTNTKEIPIIFLTAKTEKNDIAEAFRIGGSDYISKPFFEEELIARVRTQLDLLSSKRNMLKQLNQRKKIQDKLQKNKEKLKVVIDSIPDLIFYKDANSKYTGCNKAYTNFLGLNYEEIINKTDFDLYPEKEAKIFIDSDKKIISNNDEIQFQEWINNYKGKKVFLDTKKTALKNKKDVAYGIVGISRDITTLKNTERELENYKNHLENLVDERTKELMRSENKFRSIFNTSNDAIFITDIEGNYLEVNKVSSIRAGISKEEFLNKNIINFFNEYDITEYFTKIKNNQTATFTAQYTTPQGKEVTTEIFGKLISFNNKIAILHISRDITERVEIQKQILQSVINTEERERTRFAKDLHDGIGAKLSAIKMYLNLIKRAKVNEEEGQKLINETIELVDLSAKSAKEIAVNMRPHELAHFGLIRSIKSFCHRINKTGDVHINLNSDNLNDNLQIKEETELFTYRIVSELINNSLKYASAENINIDISSEEKNIILDYSDNGTGFEIDKVVVKKEGGLGIGNIINRVKTLGGKVNFESEIGNGMSAKIQIKID